MRNCAGDFIRAPQNYGIRMRELTLYSEWLGFSTDDKKGLLQALTQSLGGRIEEQRFWTPDGIASDTFVVGVFWNTDVVDLEDLFSQDVNMFCSYQPFVD